VFSKGSVGPVFRNKNNSPLQNTEEAEKFTLSNTQREGLILGYSLSSILARSGNLNMSFKTKDIKNKGPHQQNEN
jgi:hypothetical protein